MNIIELLRWGEVQLKASGIADPRLDADLLLGRVLGFPRERLYLEREWVVPVAGQEVYRALVARR
ncbi:MAG: peptide chain release factor N(5)-glutamine methyltransferase, partial [Desulfitobacteriaceae bacterium]|nr:peptide chain release factor N(5)-glutamine methyltransferase [Desulfitobacteriaceae bacterium]